jgi:hypothetical protein
VILGVLFGTWSLLFASSSFAGDTLSLASFNSRLGIIHSPFIDLNIEEVTYSVAKMVQFCFLVSAALLSSTAGVSAFTPSFRPNAGIRSKSSLSMSAALIVQNKGGGHGELGKISACLRGGGSETFR